MTNSAANIRDPEVLEEAVDAIEPIKKPHNRPKKPRANKAYDFPRLREAMRKRSITPRVALRSIESGEMLLVARTPRGKEKRERRLRRCWIGHGISSVAWEKPSVGNAKDINAGVSRAHTNN